ncbi:MAG: hypothetical protein Q8K30_06130 [Candidatus Gracilibacteria bacterium]|nr:hypothetical protein [Candidatus Gracilibacteria bacterium]
MKKILLAICFTVLLVGCFGNDDEVKTQSTNLSTNNTGATSTGNTSTGVTKTNSGELKNKGEATLPEASGLVKDIEDFNVNYKKALISTSEGSQISIGLTKNITEKWGNIISNYRGYKVVGFEKTVGLDDKLIAIGINLLNASDYVTSGKMDLAYEELLKVGVSINKMREENGIKSIRDDMQSLKDKIQLIVNDGDNKDANKFKDLGTQIEKLIEYNTDNKEYKQILGDLEKLIINVSNLTGQDYNYKLIELKSEMEKFYVKFG